MSGQQGLGGGRRRYDSEEAQRIQNELDLIETKYKQDTNLEDMFDKIPIDMGEQPERSRYDAAEDEGDDDRRNEEIDLDDLGLDPHELGRDRHSTRAGGFGLGIQPSRKMTQMNNPLAALIMSLNIDETVEPEKEAEVEETDDIDKLIELSHNRDRGVRGQTTVGGGFEAIDSLREGSQSLLSDSNPLFNPPRNDDKERSWGETITLKVDVAAPEKILVEGGHPVETDQKSPGGRSGEHEDSKGVAKLMSGLFGVIGKPISFVKNMVTTSKDHSHADQHLNKTISIDELISQQKREEKEQQSADAPIVVKPTVVIPPPKPRKVAFDDTWIFQIKSLIQEHLQEYEDIQIDKEKIMAEARNKLLGITQPLEALVTHKESSIAKVTTSSVLKLDQLTNDPQITNSVSLQLHQFGSKSEITPYKVLLDAFSEQEKQRLKENKKKRESVSSRKLSASVSSMFHIGQFPAISDPLLSIDEGVSRPFTSLLRSVNKSASTHFCVSADMTLAVVSMQDTEVIELDMKKQKTHKDKYAGGLCSIDINPNNTYWSAGFSNGEVLVKKTYGGWAQKRNKLEDNQSGANNSKKAHRNLSVRFAGVDVVLAANDTHIWRLTVKDLKVVLDLSKTNVWRCSGEDLEICEIRTFSTKGAYYLSVSTLPGTIRLLSVAATLTELAKITKPEQVESDSIPSMGFIEQNPQESESLVAVVFWEHRLILVSCQPSHSNVIKVSETPRGKRILDGQIVRGHLVCMILEDYTIEVGTVESLFGISIKAVLGEGTGIVHHQFLPVLDQSKQSYPWAGLQQSIRISSHQFAKPREVGFRFDGSQTLSFSEICRVAQNHIFLLGNEAFSAVKIANLSELCNFYVEKGLWLSSFKLCVFYSNRTISVPKAEENTARKLLTELSIQITTKRPSVLYNNLEEEWNDPHLIDKSIRADHQIAKLCIDALMNSGNTEFLLGQFRNQTDEIVLWQMIDQYIQAGHVENVPVEAYPVALKHLAAESVEYLIYHSNRQALLANSDKLPEIMKNLWYRKLWNCVYRLGLVVFEDTLYSIFNTLLSDCKQTLLIGGESHIAKYVDAALSFDRELIPQIWQEDPHVEEYLRLVWFLKTLCSWNVSNIIEDVSRVEITLNYVIAWMVLPQNLRSLDALQINVCLEIFLDLFSNVDFSSNPKAFELVRRNVEPFKTKLAAILGPVNSKPLITIPEGADGIKFKMFLVFKILEDCLFEHCHLSRRVEISYFGIELILLSVFGKFPYQDIKFIQNLLVNLLSEPFTLGRLWHRFLIATKEEFEEKITKFVSRLQEYQAFDDCKETLMWLAKENKHLRVLGFLLEHIKGPVEALPVYIELSLESPSTSANLILWMKKKLTELKDGSPQQIEMGKQILLHIDTIVVFH